MNTRDATSKTPTTRRSHWARRSHRVLGVGSLAFLKGDIGQILKVVPIVMLFVLVVSLAEAFLILPHHLAHSLDAGSAPRHR